MVKEISQDQQKLVDRRQAAAKLGVTIRTIDRYIRSGKLPKQEIAGRIFIPIKEVNKFAYFRPADIETTPNSVAEEKVPKTADNTPYVIPEETESKESAGTKVEVLDQGTYQKLFEELQQEIKEKQERLEGANYRVGQLESQIKESIPLLEYQKAIAEQAEQREKLETMLLEFQSSGKLLQSKIEDNSKEIDHLNLHLRRERIIKNIFLTILILLFLLQPLWLLLPPQ